MCFPDINYTQLKHSFTMPTKPETKISSIQKPKHPWSHSHHIYSYLSLLSSFSRRPRGPNTHGATLTISANNQSSTTIFPRDPEAQTYISTLNISANDPFLTALILGGPKTQTPVDHFHYICPETILNYP